jgi:hypothetical protein
LSGGTFNGTQFGLWIARTALSAAALKKLSLL